MTTGEWRQRAARYHRQVTGYSAFVPADLPPDPPVALDDELLTLLSRADRALGRLDGSIQTLPNPDLFVFMYVRKEAVLSSQIEGTQSSLNDVLEAEASIFDPERPDDSTEVLNYVQAMNHGLRRLPELPISVRLIREIHERLLHGVRGHHQRPGEIRTTQNWIGPPGSTLNEAVFVPPPPDVAMNALGRLEIFIHQEQKQIPLLVKVGMIHAQFETIHPFLDGNGRIGRLLVTFLLCASEVLVKPVLYLSHYFKKNREEYYERLQTIRDHGEWEAWLRFFIRGVAEVSLEATETARDIVDLRERYSGVISKGFGRVAGNGFRLFQHLFERPITTVGAVATYLDASYPTASALVDRFVDAGILVEITGRQRYRAFQFEPYIDLFREPRSTSHEDNAPH